MESTETLIIGGGQAGLAMSSHLSRLSMPHLILERCRIAERWRSERWDSLVANGPAWHDRFPDLEFAHVHPDSFAGKAEIVRYFETYAKQIAAPICCGVEVTALRRTDNGQGFFAETTNGTVAARNVVVATGPFQKPLVPPTIPESLGISQYHSSQYRNPTQLPLGAVLVVGAGSSGVQIADELQRAGRKVFLSVGPHNKPPRRYRGKDFVWWLGVLGHWNARTPSPNMEHVTIAVSGARGGHTVDFRQLAADGMTLLGMTGICEDGVLTIGEDLVANIRRGDADYLSVLDAADAYAKAAGLDLPEEPGARTLLPDPTCMTNPLRRLDLKRENITSIIWATGYALDFSWVKLDIFDAKGRPHHARGVSVEPGLYFLGLPWLARRASPFIWGVWHDAEYLASQIAR